MDDCKNLVVIDLEDYPETTTYNVLQSATESTGFTENENINFEEPGPSASTVDNLNFESTHGQQQFSTDDMVITLYHACLNNRYFTFNLND